MEIDAKHFTETMYEKLEEKQLTDPSDFNNQIVLFHTQEFVEKLCGHSIAKEIYDEVFKEIDELWNVKYGSKQMWAFCCGTLIYLPQYMDKECPVIKCFTEEAAILERRC